MRQQTEDEEEDVLGCEVLAGGQEQVHPGEHGQQDTPTLPADRQHTVGHSRGHVQTLPGVHRGQGEVDTGHLASCTMVTSPPMVT